MSNDVTVLSDIKNQLATIEQGVDEETRAVAGAGGALKRISIKGGVFRKYASGKEVAAVPDRFMHIIFAKMAPHPSRMWYPQAYEENKKISPTCWSGDAQTPDAEVTNPPAKACKDCPNSAKGSGRDGKSTACRLSWRTAVVLPNDPSGDLMQLVIPAASVWGEEYNGARPFLPYIRFLATNNISAGRVVTKMEFDLRRPSPTLLFSPIAAVPQDDLPKVQSQGKTTAADMAVKLTVFQVDNPVEDEVPPHEPDSTLPAGVTEVSEPTLREDKKTVVIESPTETPKTEMSAVIKKWAKGRG